MRIKGYILDELCEVFPFLKNADDEVREQVLKHASIIQIPKGEFIFFEGDKCKQLAFVLSGSVRVYKTTESGREITLYRLGKGESCILTTSCIFAQDSFPAIAVTEEEVKAAIVPARIFREWFNRYEVWRSYVFNLLSRRLSEIMATLEEVAFRRMDIRIAEFFMKLSGNTGGVIKITHQDIAMELGTSREVVSRILKHFEYEKLISLKRGVISIQDIDRLKRKIDQDKF